MVRQLIIAASAVVAAATPVARAGASDRFSYGHHGYGTRHAQRHYHFRHGWPIAVPRYDRYYRGGYYVTRTVVIDRVTRAVPDRKRTENDSYVHQLSERLERLSNELCLDLHYNYRHNSGFAETYQDAYQILEAARYIHDKGHRGNRAEIARRFAEVDGLLPHIKHEVGRWSRRAARQIGEGSAQTKLAAIESALLQLMSDLDIESGPDEAETAPPPAETEILPPPERLP
jgi:hypothetical protein